MKKVIVLSGSHDCGKTSTLNLVIDKLIKISGNQPKVLHTTKPRTKPYPDKTIIIEVNKIKIPVITVGDKKELIEEQIKNVVGIVTAGDTENVVDDGLDSLSQFDCDIVVCASRTYGAGLDAVKQFANEIGANLQQIKKKKLADKTKHKTENEKIANEIVEMILN